MRFTKLTSILVTASLVLLSGNAGADCTGPAAVAGALEWFSGESTYKYCNGADWTAFSSAGTLTSCTQAAVLDYDAAESAYKFCDGADWHKIACSPGGPTSCCPDLGSCSSAGTMDYLSGNHLLAFCNGSNWVSMGPSAEFAPSAGLLSYWPMDEGSGTTAADVVGGQNGSMQGAVSFVPGGGKVGGAADSPGTNGSRIQIGDVYNFAGTANFTVSLWVYLRSHVTTYSTLIGDAAMPPSGTRNGWGISLCNDPSVCEFICARFVSDVQINSGNYTGSFPLNT